ncbi:MAG: hypothetical protein HY078_00110 [Elusimicrobia bacterium]|nr:hypothetical protein [Elusimicrobiota bacterium]
MRLSAAKGQVLLQVLIMSALMVVMATVLMKMSMQQAQTATNELKGGVAIETAKSIEKTVQAAWMSDATTAGMFCSNYTWDAQNSVSCSPVGPNCGCTCTVVLAGVTYANVATSAVVSGGKTIGCTIQVSSSY